MDNAPTTPTADAHGLLLLAGATALALFLLLLGLVCTAATAVFVRREPRGPAGKRFRR
jgi:hypothetical protein